MSRRARRVRQALQADQPGIEQVGHFKTSNPEVAGAVTSAVLGAAAGMGGGGSAAGRAIRSIEEFTKPPSNALRGLPHWVLVVVNDREVSLLGSDRHWAAGPPVVTFNRGSFEAAVHSYPGQVDLTLDARENGRVVLQGKRGLFRRNNLRTAQAAARLAGPRSGS